MEEKRFILTDTENNNNKYWNIILMDNGDVKTEWGRVGYSGQSKLFPREGSRFFYKKIQEKKDKGYREQHTMVGEKSTVIASTQTLATIARKQIETNNPVAEALIARLAKENIHNIVNSIKVNYNVNSGLFSTPLGIITQTGLDTARNTLVQISDCILRNQVITPNLFNDYCTVIPQNFGMKCPKPNEFFRDIDVIRKQNDILDALQTSLQSAKVPVAGVDAPEVEEQVFSVKVHLVEDGREIDAIRKLYRSTQQSIHAASRLDVKTVYDIEIKTVADAFEKEGKKVGNIMRLYHGTKTANLLSILKTGLKLTPPKTAQIAGAVFGPGCYFSDKSTKSLNYSYGYWTGGQYSNCFMFLADVAMGKYYVPKSSSDRPFPRPGYDSIFAKEGHSGVINNEMVVFNTNQINLVKLIEFSPDGK